MMRIMWGEGKRGNKRAYVYLHHVFKRDIHFSELNRQELIEIQNYLIARMKRRGYDY